MDLKIKINEGEHWIQLAQVVPVADCCEHDNEPMGCIRSGVFIVQLRNYRLVKYVFRI